MSNYCEGDTCGRDGCAGVIETHPPENCSCHINPPCSSCTDPRNFCPVCDWQEADDVVVERVNDYVCHTFKETGVFRDYKLRELNPNMIDWHSKSHTNSSMIKEGVYPASVTTEELRKAIDGTFGGRFEYLHPPQDGKPGKFKFIAYTD